MKLTLTCRKYTVDRFKVQKVQSILIDKHIRQLVRLSNDELPLDGLVFDVQLGGVSAFEFSPYNKCQNVSDTFTVLLTFWNIDVNKS